MDRAAYISLGVTYAERRQDLAPCPERFRCGSPDFSAPQIFEPRGAPRGEVGSVVEELTFPAIRFVSREVAPELDSKLLRFS